MKRKLWIRLAAWIPAIVIGYMIFGFSAQNGDESQGLSNMVAGGIVSIADAVHIIEIENETQRSEYIEKLQVPVRKGAHMTEYAMFAASVYFGLLVWGMREWYIYVLMLLISLVFAATDEFHQLFVAQRSGQFKDVIIDTGGASIAAFIIYVISAFKND